VPEQRSTRACVFQFCTKYSAPLFHERTTKRFAKMATAGALLSQDPTNEIYDTGYTSSTDKPWAQAYPSVPKQRLKVHTTIDASGTTHVDFDTALIPLQADDERRLNEAAQAPNERYWRLDTEADIEHWWHTEVSDVVMAAWARYPRIVQTSHTGPPSVNVPESVDCTYATYMSNQRVPVLIGEMKRNFIKPRQWLARELNEGQVKLARELRGFVLQYHQAHTLTPPADRFRYAHKYETPQIFCWDGQTLLMLQFRARKAAHIRDADCDIDCWVIPRQGSSSTLRNALYRFMVQGLRRVQGNNTAGALMVGSLTEHSRQFFTGRPVWKAGDVSQIRHPEDYYRVVDAETGALKWVLYEEDPNGVWETGRFW